MAVRVGCVRGPCARCTGHVRLTCCRLTNVLLPVMAVVGSDELAAVCEHAVARLASTGGLLIPASRDPGQLVHVPFALLPRPVRARHA